ncbi:MAG: carbonic anhydrase [Candidatus Micrarchaeaceae archaeon]
MKAEAELIAGNRRFIEKGGTDFEALSKGQHPKSVVIACSDSRVAPEIIFDAKLGELFVVRTAGGVVDSAALASVEYAVEHLGTKHIAIVAHTKCGAVTAAMQSLEKKIDSKNVRKNEMRSSLDNLIEDIYTNISAKISEKNRNTVDLDSAIIYNMKAQVKKLRGSRIIKKYLDRGLKISPLIYEIETGRLKKI